MKIPIPGIKEEIKLGDAAKAITAKLGVKPCGGCSKRAEKLNAVSVVPMKIEVKPNDP